ncbi:MAG: hypothetical protein IPJ82_12300 [Lewinellaceae bacterium]|nr:hypothetical protein [Lewinellaceae bacterium]
MSSLTGRIDIFTRVTGLSFDTTFTRAEWFEITALLSVRSLSLSDLSDAKKSAGRSRDLGDLGHLMSS